MEIAFDDDRIVGYAGLVPVMRLAEDVGLAETVNAAVRLPGPVGSNPGGKLAAVVAGMVAGADTVDGLDRLRHGGMGQLFDQVYAPSTLGSTLRAFTFGHVRQLQSAARQVLAGLTKLAPIHAGHFDAAAYDLDAGVGEDGVEHLRVLAVSVPDQVFHLAAGILEVHDNVAGDLVHPGGGGCCGGAEDADASGGVFDDREDVRSGAAQRDRLDEVGCQQRMCL